MYGVKSFKMIDARQAKLINNYRNTKYKLLKTNAARKPIVFEQVTQWSI
jgi:hypothetical protein